MILCLNSEIHLNEIRTKINHYVLLIEPTVFSLSIPYHNKKYCLHQQDLMIMFILIHLHLIFRHMFSRYFFQHFIPYCTLFSFLCFWIWSCPFLSIYVCNSLKMNHWNPNYKHSDKTLKNLLIAWLSGYLLSILFLFIFVVFWCNKLIKVLIPFCLFSITCSGHAREH